MKTNEVVIIELQLSTDQIETSINKIGNSLAGLKETIASVGNEFSDIFSTIQMNADILAASMEQMATPITDLAKSLNEVAESDFSALVTELGKLKGALVDIYGQMENQQAQDLATSIGAYAFSAAELGWNIYSKLSEKDTNSKGSSKGGIKVKVRKKGSDDKSTGGKSDCLGIAAGGIGTVFGLDAMDGSLGDLLSDAAEGGNLTAMFSNLSTVVADAGQKMREFGSAIGTAFSNFGSTIAQLATSTGTWIANTAAKVANTAAQWAQVAATTAWQAICTAATAVTTAFGAAMNFLASPIGLVVIAIVALIAIIVLLIANWDTVKAAVLTAWDTIKAALGTAAEWFNTNVIQPFVGFFTMLIDWISTKLQEGLVFVQGIFAGISEFLQGMFAKDWTEQFGAFGNVLNAFFANVENVWNAVKDIFNGIVSFVKNVFAGDWGAAWDSIVSVFKSIWDYLVAIVKAPINIIIGLINGLVQGVVDGINLVIGALNGISFDIPDWVPVVGGQTFGFNLTPLVAPKIPLLAKGAVLPANKPFLAMVGDQRHGTNVEAPLTTIQEAVAQVMENQFSGMMAGFEASVAVQKQILHAVLGIEVGDTTIGQAANRYNRRMAIIKGGM